MNVHYVLLYGSVTMKTNTKVLKSPRGAWGVLLKKNRSNSMWTEDNKFGDLQLTWINKFSDEIRKRRWKFYQTSLCSNKLEPFRPEDVVEMIGNPREMWRTKIEKEIVEPGKTWMNLDGSPMADLYVERFTMHMLHMEVREKGLWCS